MTRPPPRYERLSEGQICERLLQKDPSFTRTPGSLFLIHGAQVDDLSSALPGNDQLQAIAITFVVSAGEGDKEDFQRFDYGPDPITSDCMVCLAEAINSLGGLLEVSVYFMGVSEKSKKVFTLMSAFFSNLKNTSITNLGISGSLLDDQTAETIKQYVQTLSMLKRFSFTPCFNTHETPFMPGLHLILNAVNKNTLVSLSLENTLLDGEDQNALCILIQHGKLESLGLFVVGLVGGERGNLYGALKNNCSIRALASSTNESDPTFCTGIYNMLHELTNLTSVTVCGPTKFYLDRVAQNPSIRHLIIKSFTNTKDVSSVAAVVRTSRTLRELTIEQANLHTKAKVASKVSTELAQALVENPTLEYLSIGSVGNDFVEIFAAYLPRMMGLKTLILRDNAEGAKISNALPLVAAIPHNSSLCHLFMDLRHGNKSYYDVQESLEPAQYYLRRNLVQMDWMVETDPLALWPYVMAKILGAKKQWFDIAFELIRQRPEKFAHHRRHNNGVASVHD